MRPRRHRATCSSPRQAAEETDHIASFVVRRSNRLDQRAAESCRRENGGDDGRRSGNEPDPREVDSTIKTPVCSATRNQQASPRRWRRAHGEAALHSCANAASPIRDRAEPARKPPGIVGLGSLNPASPESGSMLFRQT